MNERKRLDLVQTTQQHPKAEFLREGGPRLVGFGASNPRIETPRNSPASLPTVTASPTHWVNTRSTRLHSTPHTFPWRIPRLTWDEDRYDVLLLLLLLGRLGFRLITQSLGGMDNVVVACRYRNHLAWKDRVAEASCFARPCLEDDIDCSIPSFISSRRATHIPLRELGFLSPSSPSLISPFSRVAVSIGI